MLNGKKVNISTGTFDAIPMDKYTVQIKDVNLIQAPKFQSTELEDVLNYQFVILDDKKFPDTEKQETTTRGRFLWQRCRLSLNDRSTWGKMVTAVIGRELTKEEKSDFDPESIVGRQVDVMVNQAPSKNGDRIFNNIVAFSKNVKPLPEYEFEKEKPAVVTRTKAAVPETAPDDSTDPEKFINTLESENAVTLKVDESDEEEESAEELELKLKLARAKAKAAKAKAKK